MGNLSIYQQVRSVPESAQKTISGGRNHQPYIAGKYGVCSVNMPDIVLDYIKTTASVPVNLPASHPFCRYCIRWLRYEPNYGRYSCRITEESLFDIERSIGEMCPLRKE